MNMIMITIMNMNMVMIMNVIMNMNMIIHVGVLVALQGGNAASVLGTFGWPPSPVIILFLAAVGVCIYEADNAVNITQWIGAYQRWKENNHRLPYWM